MLPVKALTSLSTSMLCTVNRFEMCVLLIEGKMGVMREDWFQILTFKNELCCYHRPEPNPTDFLNLNNTESVYWTLMSEKLSTRCLEWSWWQVMDKLVSLCGLKQSIQNPILTTLEYNWDVWSLCWHDVLHSWSPSKLQH